MPFSQSQNINPINKKASLAQPSKPLPSWGGREGFGVNRWVSTLSLSGDEARVFDVLYRKSHKTPFCIYSRRFFWLHFHQEFFGIGQRRFDRFLAKFQALCILILEKKEDGIYMRTFAQPYAQQQELALDVEPQAETYRSLAAHSMCGASSQTQEVSEKKSPVSQKESPVSEKKSPVSQKKSPVSAPHTPLYKEEKNRKERISSCFQEAADAPRKTTTKTTVLPIPTFEEVCAYAKERGATKALAKKFFQYYSGNGWMVGRNRIANWQAVFALWADKEPKRPQPKSQGGAPAQLSTINYQLSTEEPIKVLSDKERAEAQAAMQQTLENIARLEQQMQDPGGRKKAERQRKAELLHATPRAATPCPSWMEKRPEWSFRRDEGAEGELGAARRYGAMCKGQPEDVVLNMMKQKYPAREDEVLRQEFLRAYRGI